MNLSPAPVREEMYRDGKMTTPWVRWFDAVYSRVGGTSDPLTTEIENRASDEQPHIIVEEHSHFEEADIGAAIQASLDLAPVKSVFGRTGENPERGGYVGDPILLLQYGRCFCMRRTGGLGFKANPRLTSGYLLILTPKKQ